MRKSGIFSFHYFFYNYGRFHDDCVNQAIHMVFVPVLLFTGLIGLFHCVNWVEEDIPKNPFLERINYMDFYILALWIAFLYVEKVIALAFISWSLPLLMAAHYMFENRSQFEMTINGETYSLCYIMTSIHIFAWITQFLGHGVYEQRAPALVTNLLFANFAFFFVTFEALNNLFGYGEGKKLNECRKAIMIDINEYRASRGLKLKQKQE